MKFIRAIRLSIAFLAVSGSAPAFAADKVPFSVDAEKLLSIFIAAVADQYPEIPAENLKSTGRISGMCFPNDPNQKDQLKAALDESFKPCIAYVSFDVDPKPATSSYQGHEGKCEVSSSIVRLTATLQPADSSVSVRSRKDPNLESKPSDCAADQPTPPSETPVDIESLDFAIDPREILELAVDTVIGADPKIRKADLFLGGPISLYCNAVDRTVGSTPGLHMKLSPCHAKAGLGIKPETVQSRHVRADGSCVVQDGIANAKVQVNQDGSVHLSLRNGYYGTGDRVVECTQEFFEMINQRVLD